MPSLSFWMSLQLLRYQRKSSADCRGSAMIVWVARTVRSPNACLAAVLVSQTSSPSGLFTRPVRALSVPGGSGRLVS
jgi:hypothetical protein